MLYPNNKYQEKDEEWLQAKLIEVDWDIKRDLVNVLDSQQGSWRDLVSVLPDWLVVHIPVPQLQQLTSPSEALMQMLEQWGFTVAQLISCLETLEMENALMIIKPDVELKIIEDLSKFVEVETGERLQLTCRASGFPTPYYQWFKDGEELIAHQHHRLELSNISQKNAGVYHCKVYTIDRVTNEEQANPIYSVHCQVNVVEPLSTSPKLAPTSCRPPEIELQPRSLGDLLPHGCSFTLECRAIGDPPISYKWFKDHEELYGETDSKLHLCHLMPDETTGTSRWQYMCLVSNPYGQVISDSVTVGLSLSRRDLLYTAKDKIALLIANENYEHMQSFKLPSSDAATLSEIFRSLNFRVMSYVNLTLSEMFNAVRHFCAELDKGSYGFFYFAGHGFADQGQSYMQPVDATDSCAYEENVCVDFVASKMQKRDPALSFLLLDMCRERPDYGPDSPKQTPRYSQQEKYKNIFFAYATSFLGEAVEVEGDTNGLFVQYLKRHLTEKKSICEIVCAVKQDMSCDHVAKTEGQDPDVSFNISEPRTLRDPILEVSPEKLEYDQKWQRIYKCPPREHFKLGTFRFIISFRLHKGTFCNAIDMDIHFKESLSPGQSHSVSVDFWPKLKVQERTPEEPEYLKLTLKGLQTLKGPVQYQITLKTSEELRSEKYYFSMTALSSLDLSTNRLSDYQHYI